MRYLLINTENDFLVEHILPAREGWEFNAELYPDYYMVYEDIEDKITTYNMRFNQETGEFEEVEDYEEVETVIEPSKLDILGARTDNIETELMLTQSALDFLLMTSMDAMGVNNMSLEKGERVMAGYLAMRIIRGMLSYKEVITKYPEFKEDIDFILKTEGKGDLITP